MKHGKQLKKIKKDGQDILHRSGSVEWRLCAAADAVAVSHTGKVSWVAPRTAQPPHPSATCLTFLFVSKSFSQSSPIFIFKKQFGRRMS